MYTHDAYRYDHTEPLSSGTRWEFEDVVKDALTRVDLMEKHYSACGMPMISDGRVAYVDNSDAHSLIIGSTGSKKTRLFGMPMMEMYARAGESVVCTDPKGELYEKTSGLYKSEGYDIQVINLRDPVHSNGWNPLYDALTLYKEGNEERATEMINDLAACIFTEKKGTKADPFWYQTSRAVFQSMCHLLVEGSKFFTKDQVCLGSVPCLVKNITGTDTYGPDGHTNQLIDALPPTAMARTNFTTAIGGSSKTFDNVMVSYNSDISFLYSRKSLVNMLSRHDLVFENLGLKKTILYLIMPDEKTALHPLVSLIIKRCYEALINLAQQQQSKTLPVRVNFMLDEFSNLPAIPDMCAMISAARSRNIRFFLIIQGLQQLESKYGADDAATIKANCTNWAFLTSRELKLLQELESLCGTSARTRQPLISVSQLQRLNKQEGESLILCGRLYPYIAHLADIDQYPFAAMNPEPLPYCGRHPVVLTDLRPALRKALPKTSML